MCRPCCADVCLYLNFIIPLRIAFFVVLCACRCVGWVWCELWTGRHVPLVSGRLDFDCLRFVALDVGGVAR